MTEATSPDIQTAPAYPAGVRSSRRLSALWPRIALGTILLISLFLNFYRLGQMGYMPYYPAAVRSMMDNWHNFFFAAYDTGGFSSLDKPPVGFWLQVLSAKIFGLTPFSVLLPQAMCGVLAVLLLYFLVRRQFGVTAGLLAALALTLSPISVVTNRNETIDSTLALGLLIGAWAVLRAVSSGRLRWLLLCAVTVGIGFNIKMLEAYLVIPAFGLFYLFAAPLSIWKRLWHLALALCVLLVISFSWALIVDFTPATLRPHVAATQDNSMVGLSFGYNGLQRLLGTTEGASSANQQPANNQPAPPNGNTRPGAPLPLVNLFTEPLAGQSSWLLPLALWGMLALMKFRRPFRPRNDPALQGLLLWGMWLLTMGIFFGVARFFHEYYLTVMAPAIAALVGIGLVTMWRDYQCGGWRAWLLPLALISTAAEQIFILTGYPAWGQWLIPLIGVLCLLTVVLLLVGRLSARFPGKTLLSRFSRPVLAGGLAALMLGPALWAALPIFQNTEAVLPHAGPQTVQGGPGPGQAELDPGLIRYLETNQGHTHIMVAASGEDADRLILATNRIVMPLDGFSFYPLTATELASLVAQGKLRFLLIRPPQPDQSSQQMTPEPGQSPPQSAGRGGGVRPAGLEGVIQWTMQHCAVVPASRWQTSSVGSASRNVFGFNQVQLYDCTAPSR